MQSRRASWLGGKWDKKTCRYLICIGRHRQRLQLIDISLIILESSVSNHAGYQCPTTGYPHFYGYRRFPAEGKERCVNALTRAILISTFLRGFKDVESMNECQCPISGHPHFYPTSLEPAI